MTGRMCQDHHRKKDAKNPTKRSRWRIISSPYHPTSLLRQFDWVRIFHCIFHDPGENLAVSLQHWMTRILHVVFLHISSEEHVVVWILSWCSKEPILTDSHFQAILESNFAQNQSFAGGGTASRTRNANSASFMTGLAPKFPSFLVAQDELTPTMLNQQNVPRGHRIQHNT